MPGVGARQAAPGLSTQGGGYQDVCTVLEFQKKSAGAEKTAPPRDPRIDDLRAIGVLPEWVRAAEEVGVDAVLTIWRIMDASPSALAHGGASLRVSLPLYRTFLRYQRNRYIETLRDGGLSPHQIRTRLQRQFGERLSLSHIRRICARG